MTLEYWRSALILVSQTAADADDAFGKVAPDHPAGDVI
jgi:hypothetical protein